MKKLLSIIASAALLFAAASCSFLDISEDSDSKEKSEYGRIVFSAGEASLTDITLKGTKGSETKEFGSWANNEELGAAKNVLIPVGTWDFTLSAKKDGVLYVGTQTATIKKDAVVTISFAMKSINYVDFKIVIPFTVAGEAEPVISASASAKIYKGEELVDTINAKGEKLYGIGAPKGDISQLNVDDQLIVIEDNSIVVVPHNTEKGLSKLEPSTEYKVVLEGISGVTVDEYSFTTKAPKVISGNVINVGSAESDNFYTIQGALNYLASSKATGDWTINVAAGKYHEMLWYNGSANVKLVGAVSEFGSDTYVYWRNSQVLNPKQRARQSFIWQGGNLTIENMTFENTTNRKVEGNTNVQAETLVFDVAKNLVVYNSSFLSYQDTLLIGNNGGRAWFYNCYVAGDVDFIWGTADVCLLENCKIVCRADGIKNDAKIFASRTVSGEKTAKGFILMDSEIEVEEGCKAAYGRSSGADTQAAVFHNVFTKGAPDPALWGSPSDTILYEANGEMAVGYKDFENYHSDETVVDTSARKEGTADMSERLYNREYNGRWTIFNRVYNKTTKAYEFASNIYDITSVAATYGAPKEDSINNIYTEPVYKANVVGGYTVQLTNASKATGLTYTYESANDLATVDANGLVTTTVGGNGLAVITVRASNGKKDVVTIKVIPRFINVESVSLTAPETVDVYSYNKVVAAINPEEASVTTLNWTVTGDIKIVNPNDKNLVTSLTTTGLKDEGDFVYIEGFKAGGSGTITVTSVDTETATDTKTIAISNVRDYNALEAVAVNSKDAAAGCGILNAQSKVVMWHDVYVEGMLNGSGGKIAASGERVQSRLGKMFIPVTESVRIDVQCQKFSDDPVIIPDENVFKDKTGKKPTSSIGPESEGNYPYHYTFELDYANDINKLEEGSAVKALFDAATKDTNRTWVNHTPDENTKYFVIVFPTNKDIYWTHIRVTPDSSIHHEAPTAILSIENFATASQTLDLNGVASVTATTTASVSDGSGTPAIAYTSSNPNVVKVDASTGVATAVGIGRATITATASMGELDDASTSYDVLVKDTKVPEGSYAVDFKSGNLISASSTNNVNVDFGYVKIDVGNQNAYGYNGNQHGAVFKAGNVVKLAIPAAATVKLGGCQYNKESSVIATASAGTVTPNTSVTTTGTANSGTATCDGTIDFTVSEACELSLAFSGENYVPQIEVIAGKAFAEGTYDFASKYGAEKSGELAAYTLSVNGFEVNTDGHDYGCVIKNSGYVKMAVKGDCTITFTGSTYSNGNMTASASAGTITPDSQSCKVATDKTGTYSFTYNGGEAVLTFTADSRAQAYTPSVTVTYSN